MTISSKKARLSAGVLAATALASVVFLRAADAAPQARPGTVTVSEGQVSLRTTEGTTELVSDDWVSTAAPSPRGGRVALASGERIRVGTGGVRGEVSIVDASTGKMVLETSFGDAIITGVSYSPDGNTVAFVKDYEELWSLDTSAGKLRRLVVAGAPPMAGSTLFDPVFDTDGKSVLVGVVEETFNGEDDKLDNLWRVGLDGRAERVTDFEAPARGWRVLRSPVPLPGSGVLVTGGTHRDAMWSAAVVRPDGSVTEAGPVPPLSSAVAASSGEILFTSPGRGGFDLYAIETNPRAPHWHGWCDNDSCELLEPGVDGAAFSARSD